MNVTLGNTPAAPKPQSGQTAEILNTKGLNFLPKEGMKIRILGANGSPGQLSNPAGNSEQGDYVLNTYTPEGEETLMGFNVSREGEVIVKSMSVGGDSMLKNGKVDKALLNEINTNENKHKELSDSILDTLEATVQVVLNHSDQLNSVSPSPIKEDE